MSTYRSLYLALALGVVGFALLIVGTVKAFGGVPPKPRAVDSTIAEVFVIVEIPAAPRMPSYIHDYIFVSHSGQYVVIGGSELKDNSELQDVYTTQKLLGHLQIIYIDPMGRLHEQCT